MITFVAVLLVKLNFRVSLAAKLFTVLIWAASIAIIVRVALVSWAGQNLIYDVALLVAVACVLGVFARHIAAALTRSLLDAQIDAEVARLGARIEAGTKAKI